MLDDMHLGLVDFPDPPEQPMPRCPVCGEECETVYWDVNNQIVGCDNCLLELDAYEWYEEERRDGKYRDI